MNIRKDDIVEVITGDDASTPKARTTARVLRTICDEMDRDTNQKPFFIRLWWKLVYENNNEIRRKADLIERVADMIDRNLN